MTRPQFTRKELIGNNNTGNSTVGVNGDGSLNVQSTILAYNGTSSDRIYNNTQGTLLASASRSGTYYNTPNQTNYNAKGIILFLNVTVASGTGGLTLGLVAVDPTSGVGSGINPATTNITATGIYNFIYYPGIGTAGLPAGNKGVGSVTLPRVFYIQVYHGDVSAYTYSLGYSFIN